MLQSRLGRVDTKINTPAARYLFAVAAVLVAFVLRMVLLKLVGTGAPFILFFAAILATSLVAGTGPAISALAMSIALVAIILSVGAGRPVSKVAVHALLYSVDAVVMIYVTYLMRRGQRELVVANRELQQSNDERTRLLDKTRQIIELAPDGYLMANLDAGILEVNEATCRLLGYECDELIGRTLFDVIPATDAPRLDAVKAKLRTPGSVSTTEWTLLRKDGMLVPVEVSSNILPDGRWQAFARDISPIRRLAAEREQALVRERAARRDLELANEKLRDSEERERLIIDEAPIGVAVLTLDGHFTRVNRRFSAITGYSADELVTMSVLDITPADCVADDVSHADALIRGESPWYQLAKTYIRKDKTTVEVMVSRSLLRGPNGMPLSFISQVEDITERKRAEVALRRSEAKFSGIVSIASDAIISVDEQQCITLFNEGAETIFGYSKQEMIGQKLERLLPTRVREAHASHFAGYSDGRVAARPMAPQREVFGLRKNGEEFPAEASISKVSVDGVMYFSVVLRDITYRKNIEHALQAAVQARDDVLGIVAHDLRNPLSTISMQISAMEEGGPSPDRRDRKPLEVIARSAGRMSYLIRDLLDVAVLEGGGMKLDYAPVRVPELTREVVDMQTPLASAAGLEIQLDVAPDVVEVSADRNRLLQVFENLMGNAIKFSRKGGRITVRASTADEGVKFSISDTGIGIAAENLPRLFERFWQATTRSRRLGAGLGLPITKGIIEAHGGRIWAESKPGEGTTFYFIIPTKVAAERRGATRREAERPTRRARNRATSEGQGAA